MWCWALLACVRTPPPGDGDYDGRFDGDPGDPPTDTTPPDTTPTDTTEPSGDCDPATAGVDCTACDQAGMWVDTQGLSGSALVDELHRLTADHFCNDYGPATEFMFVELDNVDGYVECVYTGRTTPVGNTKPDATDMNTEHTWPQSQGADTFPAECDLHHLYPTDAGTNSLRGNYPFGVVVDDTASVDGGSRFGTDAHGETVFEPRDAHKGNVARSMLYFAMRYGYSLEPDQVALFQGWAALDPVDDTEVERTFRVADRQGAVNPYVTCPWLVDAL